MTIRFRVFRVFCGKFFKAKPQNTQKNTEKHRTGRSETEHS